MGLGRGQADRQTAPERTVDELCRLDDPRSAFVMIASHELRTPIAAVHGIASTLELRASDLGDDQLRTLHRELFRQTTRLRDLAEQLLELSRLDAGVRLTGGERFRAKDRLDAVLGRVACDRNADVLIAVDPSLELELDPLAFDGVVSNLLDNALRYGEPPIEVTVAGGRPRRLLVEDSGEGVEPAFVPLLFERFTRSERAGRLRPEGAGLGLAIAAQLASGVGGSLCYEARATRGARFTFRLPA